MNTGALLFCTSLTVTITVPITSYGHGTEDEGHIVKVERSIDTCQENISEPIYTANNKYCKCCRPGFYKLADCVKSGGEARCRMCPAEQYSSTYNQAYRCALCVPPAFCSKENVERYQGCTRTSNIKCRCRAGYYFKERLGSVDDGDCMELSKCGAGKYIFQKGTRVKDTVCHHCPNGTFSTSENNLVCQNCSICETTSDTVPQKCTAKTDTKCYSKQQGHGGDGSMIKIIIPCAGVVVVVALVVVIVYILYKRKRGCMKNIQRFLRLPTGDNVDGDRKAMKLQSLQTCNSQSINGHVTDDRGAAYDPQSTTNTPLFDQTSPQLECVQFTNEEGHGQGIRKLSESPVNGSFKFLQQQDGNSLTVPVLQSSKETQGPSTENEQDKNMKKAEERRQIEKMWEQCYLYLSWHIVKEWKHVIRALFVATAYTKRPVETIIEEVEANHQNNVTEQFYQALRKWHNSMEPKNLDLRCIIDALSANKLMDTVEELQKEFSPLIREKQSVNDVLPERTDRQTDKESLLSETDAEFHRNS